MKSSKRSPLDYFRKAKEGWKEGWRKGKLEAAEDEKRFQAQRRLKRKKKVTPKRRKSR